MNVFFGAFSAKGGVGPRRIVPPGKPVCIDRRFDMMNPTRMVLACVIAAALATAQSACGLTPTQLSGCVLWLDGNDLDGDGSAEGNGESGLSGSKVARWDDRSANDNDALQNTDGNRPTFVLVGQNNRPTVRFTGGSKHYMDLIDESKLDVGASFTILFVAKSTSGVAFGKGGGYHEVISFSMYGSVKRYRFWNTTGQGTIYLDSSDTDNAGTFQRRCMAANGSTLQWYVNNVAGNYESQGSHSINNDRAFRIGGRDIGNPDNMAPFTGDIAELVVYNRTLNATERGQLESYFYDKWFRPDEPEITNAGGATNVTGQTAWLNGLLTSTGTAATTVFAFWGPEDKEDDKDTWAHWTNFGERAEGEALTTNIAGLIPETWYYYRVYASNEHGSVWGTPSSAFKAVDPLPIIPSDLSGCTLWLDAADLDGDGTQEADTEDGLVSGKVLTWSDKSPNDNGGRQQTAGNRPTYETNALRRTALVRFAGVSEHYMDLIDESKLDVGASFTILFVAKGTSGVVFGKGGGFHEVISFSMYGSVKNYRFWNTAGLGSISLNSSDTDNAGTFQRRSVVANGSTVQWYVNNAAGNNESQGTHGINNDRAFRVGARDVGDPDSIAPFTGDLAELLVYNRVLNSTELGNLDDYFYEKWFRPDEPAITNAGGAT